jgi:peroxiredoxin
MTRRTIGYSAVALLLAGVPFAGAHAGAPTATAGGTFSVQALVGRPAPDFTLQDTDGQEQHLGRYLADGKIVVLEWFNPDCPFVRRHHGQDQTMKRVLDQYGGGDVVWLAINSGAPGKQGAGLERNVQAKREYGIAYPILLDPSGRVGRTYGARTTPHMFVVRADGVLVYAGAIDDDPGGEKDVAQRRNYVGEALESCRKGKAPSTGRTTAYGCTVKYGPIEM